MLQIFQHQKTGEIVIEELPTPKCFPGGILVETQCSLISAGTEKTSVASAKLSLLERVIHQPEQVKLVLDFIKKEGVYSTAQRVMRQLDSYKGFGYSAAGIVVESDCEEFSAGDRVAIAGAGYANHAEINSVPKNLAVKIPETVGFDVAAFTTVATIALQGIRQAAPEIGENVAVIGLGLIGQITVQLLRAGGQSVVGFDIDENTFELAKQNGCQAVFPSSKEYIKDATYKTQNLGFDKVIITASTSSDEPIELAIELARKRGIIVVVGAVPMNIQRGKFYQKELELKISTSYGPGRYDPFYEEVGLDYPYAYVRWTEQRNMQAIINLLASQKIDFSSLISHRYDIREASTAYSLISGKKKEPYIGIILEYPKSDMKFLNKITLKEFPKHSDKIGIGFIGAGSFSQNFLLPALKHNDVEFIGIMNSSPLSTLNVSKIFGFKNAYSSSSELLNNPDIDFIFCATRHNSHFKFVKEALLSNKPIFVEKPLCVNQNELDEIAKIYQETSARIMVGFNRQFSKPFKAIKDFFKYRKEPMNIIYRVNAGYIPKSHWVQYPENGGRIIGEVCHFINTMIFLTNSLPQSVFAQSVSSSNPELATADNITVNLKFRDGSVGSLIYSSAGDPSIPKEYCEVFCENKTSIMENFTRLTLARAGKSKTLKFDGEKGIKNEIFETLNAYKNGSQMPISFEEIYYTTKTTFQIIQSLKTNKIFDI
ncbi:MAG: bi-domain-containing oxidoreductase [Chloroherpetonaceae bacterium]